MRRLTMVNLLVAAFAFAFLVFSSSVSSAQIFDDSVSSCTGGNCSSLRLPGTVLSFGPSANAWVENLFAAPGECVRLDIASQGADLEMTVVAPNGSVFRNDDRAGASDRRPLVKIGSAPNNGWYTVHLARFDGGAVNANFVLLYGRYNGGNPNCLNPTSPFARTGPDADLAKPDAGVQAPRLHEPGSPD
jgi:hypothetical protein